ncbi:prephenate dehydrogenase [Antribacter gilvus]|uniref:prephenate dehydrogenase n=1 Tax=Antribacter gilvus TaxID=2304675 RepID=UPI000F7B71EB|nr:prephenate dehydrogenase/arogenate dehydrogenase family protein [Antribacter gilvus]
MTAGEPVTVTVGVVGLGLIGGSLARALSGRGVAVVATDVSGVARSAARHAGLDVADDVAALVARRPAILVLAAPLRAMRSVAGDVARAVEAQIEASAGWDPTVMDVGSVKGPVREAVTDAGLGGRFVGAHPMAGTERSGFTASDDRLLVGARWAVTVDDATDLRRLEQVLRLLTGPLAGTVAVLTDDLHDEATALISHVPHVLATQLLNAVAGSDVRDLALGLSAGSFRDGTRVAFSDPRRTQAMVTENAAWVTPVLRLAVRDLEALADALDANAPTHEFFDRAAAVRETRQAAVPVARVPAPGAQASGGASAGGTPAGEGSASAAERIPLADAAAALVARCAAGAVVVGVQDGAALVR